MLECEICRHWLHSKCVGLSPSLASSTPFVCAFCVKSVCLQLRDLQSEVAQVKDNLVSLENSFNCSISPPVKTEFDSLHESLRDISSKLDLFSLPLSQAAPDPPSGDPQSPQSRVASNFFRRDRPPKKTTTDTLLNQEMNSCNKEINNFKYKYKNLIHNNRRQTQF